MRGLEAKSEGGDRLISRRATHASARQGERENSRVSGKRAKPRPEPGSMRVGPGPFGARQEGAKAMIRVPLTRAKATLWAWVRGVERGGDVVVLTRRGRDVAALVPLSTARAAERIRRDGARLAEAAEGLTDPAETADSLPAAPGGT